MSGHVGPLRVHVLGDITDALLSFTQILDDRQPDRVRCSLDDFRLIFVELFGFLIHLLVPKPAILIS